VDARSLPGAIRGRFTGREFTLSPDFESVPLPPQRATAAAAVAGDLRFSSLERNAGVKDFSNLIPAHGGALDRLDSLVLGAPAFYWTLQVLAA
jgi:hypothetical protein